MGCHSLKGFKSEERIPVSWIKQYLYCKRRLALMSIDGEWGSNFKIVEGDFLHNRVNNPFINETRNNIFVSRSVPVYSNELNLYGIADIVEFIESDDGIRVGNKKGLFRLNPVEYKNGSPEKSDYAQVCAVSMCLEEMFKIHIEQADVFYNKPKRRTPVMLTEALRCEVKNAVIEIHEILDARRIPQKDEKQNCNLCSLTEICLPAAMKKRYSTKELIGRLL